MGVKRASTMVQTGIKPPAFNQQMAFAFIVNGSSKSHLLFRIWHEVTFFTGKCEYNISGIYL